MGLDYRQLFRDTQEVLQYLVEFQLAGSSMARVAKRAMDSIEISKRCSDAD
jgi:hypothetical protein